MRLDEESIKRRFEGHQKQPPRGTWEGIQSRIKARRRRRYFLGLVIPVLLLGITGLITILINTDFNHPLSSSKQDANTSAKSTDSFHNRDLARGQNKPSLPYLREILEYAIASKNSGADKADSQDNTPHQSESNMRANKSGPAQNRSVAETTKSQDEQAYRRSSSTDKRPSIKRQLQSYPLISAHLNPIKLGQNPGPMPTVKSEQLADSFQSEPDVKVKDSIKNRWMVGFKATPFVSQFQYQNKEEFNGASLEKAGSAEANGKGFRIGAQIHYKLNQALSLTAGLGYEYQQQQFNHDYQEMTIDTVTPAQLDTTVLSPGDTIINQITPPQIDTTFQGKTQTHLNQYHRFSLPVGLRYKVSSNQHWELFIEGGVRLTYLFSLNARQVKLSEPNRKGKRLLSVKQDAVEGLNLRYRIKAGIGYKLSDQWTITAAPNLEGQAFSNIKSGVLPKRRALHWGLSLGINKSF